MKIKIFLPVLFILFLSAARAQTLPADATSAGKEFFTALKEANAATLGKLLGSDFIMLSFDGQSIDAGTLLEAVSGGYIVIESGDTYSNYTRYYQDTGVVTGSWNVKGSLQGQGFSNRLAYTLVTVKQGGAWKVVSVQFTPS